MGAATDLHARYRQLLDQQREEELRRQEVERLLIRIIIRLTLAAEGHHPALDPHLKALRKLIRKGIGPSIEQRLEVLSDTLMRVTEQEEEAPSEVRRFADRLADAAGLDARSRRRAGRLAERLLESGEEADADAFREFAALLSPGAPAARPGLLGRVFQRREKGTASPNALLARVLEEIDWPPHMVAAKEEFLQRLQGEAVDPEAWIEVLRELAGMMARAMGSVVEELRETEGFLSALTEQLNELDQSLQGGEESRSDALKSGQAMSEAVRQEVGAIAAGVSSSHDLEQLKRSVARRLQVIKGAVDRHMNEYERRIREDEAREEELRRRLERVEHEAHELRSRMMHARHQALLDTVTGLPNRLAWDERLAQEVGRWRRFQAPLTLLVWDMDDFKQVNDRFGHQAGDKALRVVAGILQERIRETDFVARYGGEEFAMLLVGTDLENAHRVAEGLRRRVEAAGFHSGDRPVRLTVSCGLSEFAEGDTPEAVFARADQALYRAKAAGKNRCVKA